MIRSPAAGLEPVLRRAMVSHMVSRATYPQAQSRQDCETARERTIPEAERALERKSVADLVVLETEMRMLRSETPLHSFEYDPLG